MMMMSVLIITVFILVLVIVVAITVIIIIVIIIGDVERLDVRQRRLPTLARCGPLEVPRQGLVLRR